jgi:acid phosphatase type 7
VTPSSAIVAAVTGASQRLTLRYGPVDGDLTGRVDDPEPVQVHGLLVDGLAPATSYSYALETEDGAPLGGGAFHTAPTPDTTRATFLVFGDSGGTDESHGEEIDAADEVLEEAQGVAGDENQQGRVAAAMLGHPADLALHLGDVVYPDGARDQYPRGFFQPFAALIASTPVYPTLGNHDTKTDGGAPYLETFFLPENGAAPDSRSYSFDWANVHFATIDVVSSPYDEGSAQLRWLEQDLAATDRAWKVVWFHVPPFAVSRHADEPQLQTIVALLERARVDLVLNGNDHHFARFFPIGHVTYVTSGGGGKSLYPVHDDPRLAYAESVFHFVKVTVDGDALTLEAIDADGRTFDQVTIRKTR